MAVKKRKAKSRAKKLSLVLSKKKNPSVRLKPGMRLDVVAVSLLDPSLKKAKPGAARLCGGTNTCLALVEL